MFGELLGYTEPFLRVDVKHSKEKRRGEVGDKVLKGKMLSLDYGLQVMLEGNHEDQ